MRRYFLAAIPLLIVLATAVPAGATVVNCEGLGGFKLDKARVEYGQCNTNETSGTGSVAFSSGGRQVALRAIAQPGSEQVASTWYSYDAVATTEVCLGVDLIGAGYRGKHAIKQELTVNAESGAVYVKKVTFHYAGTYSYCRKLPRGTSIVSWQLLTTAGAGPPKGIAELTEKLESVSIT